ncbi:hypothetical protein ACFFRR_007546 [Megaselia abdita]
MLVDFIRKTDIAFRLGSQILKSDEEVNKIKNKYNFYCLKDIYFHKYLVFNSLIVKPDLVIKTDHQGSSCNFVVVRHIVKYLDNVYIAIQKLETICFDEFMFAFEVKLLDIHEILLFEDICHCLEHT